MDKKELNDLIDRVVLTGPGGVDRIKKVLKELVNGSDDSGSDSGCNCLKPMIVEGTIDLDSDQKQFLPNDGSPSIFEAVDFLKKGGIVYLKTENIINNAYWFNSNGVEALIETSPLGSISWLVPIVIHGVVDEHDGSLFFRENNGEIGFWEAKEIFDRGFPPVALSYEIAGETIIDNISNFSSSDSSSSLYTENNIIWNISNPIG